MRHTVKRKSTLVRAVASEQIAQLHKVQVRLINDRVFLPNWQHPLTVEAHEWLYAQVGKGTAKRPAFDAHEKFRWYVCFPHLAVDNTRETTWQQRNTWLRNNKYGEFWFKDAAPAMLFKLTFGG